MSAYQRAGGLVSPEELARHPWAFSCDDCHYTVSAPTEQVAEYERWTHRCPRGEAGAMSILEKAWAQLDKEVDEIMALCDENGEHTERSLVQRARARGKAEILALMMSPIFRDADAIAGEAALRWQARRAGTARLTAGVSPSTAAADMERAS